MSFISNVNNFFNRNFFQNRTDHLTRMYALYTNGKLNLTTDTEVWDSISGNEFNLFKSTPELFAVIDRKATMFSNGRFVIKDYKTNEIIENDPLYLFLEQPSPLLPRNMWLMMLSMNYDIFGNAIILMNKGSIFDEVPQSMNFLPNGEIKIKQKAKIFRATDINEIIEYYKIEVTEDKFSPDEILHLKRTNPENPVIGLSPMNALQMPISNIRGARGFRNVNIVKRGAMGMLSPDGKDAIGVQELDEQKRLDIEKQFVKDTHGIFDNQSPIKFAQIPMKYQHLAYPIKDSMLFEEISEGFKIIIDAYGLNENIFSRDKASTFSNYQEGLKSAYLDSIIPFSENFCFALNQKLGLFEKGKYIEMDYSHIPALQKNKSEEVSTFKMKVETVEKLVNLGYTIEQAESMSGLLK